MRHLLIFCLLALTACNESTPAVTPPPVVPYNGPVTISMVGDSITFLRNVSTTWAVLADDPGATNNGVPSENTSEILARMPTILDQHPRAVFFLGGVNDITTGLTQAQTVANIQSAISLCRERNVPVYVQSILMVTEKYPNWLSFNAEINARNALIRESVQALNDPNVHWLDWRDVLGYADFQQDGIHPLLSGDVKWANAIRDYTRPYR